MSEGDRVSMALDRFAAMRRDAELLDELNRFRELIAARGPDAPRLSLMLGGEDFKEKTPSGVQLNLQWIIIRYIDERMEELVAKLIPPEGDGEGTGTFVVDADSAKWEAEEDGEQDAQSTPS